MGTLTEAMAGFDMEAATDRLRENRLDTFRGALRQIGLHALIGILDSQLFKFSSEPSRILRGEIFNRWTDMVDSGGTTLSLTDWKEVYRTGAALVNASRKGKR